MKLKIEKLASGDIKVVFSADTKGITRGATMRTECLWSNAEASRASSSVVMGYSALASDFRQRERINRKIGRWTANFKGLPSVERRALLLALLDAEREQQACRPHRRKRR